MQNSSNLMGIDTSDSLAGSGTIYESESHEPTITIGVIGPNDSIEKIQKAVGNHYPKVKLVPYIRELITDSIRGFSEIEHSCDGLIFTGIGVESIIRESFTVCIPWSTIPRGGYSIMSTIWAMSRDAVNYTRMSIDVVSKLVLQEIIEEFNLSFSSLYTKPFLQSESEDSYTQFHKELYNAGKIDAIVTGFGSVYANLKQAGYPVYRLYPNTVVVRQQLESLIHQIQSNEMRSAGIGIQILHVKGMTHDSLCKYDDLKKKGELYLRVVDYVREIQGSLFSFGREEMIIFTTRGELESQINHAIFKELALWSIQQHTEFYSGIGYGNTAYEAERAARQALEHAKSFPHSCAFLVDNGKIVGPIGEHNELSYQILIDDKRILHIAEKTGIDPSYISKIKAVMKKSGKDTYDSRELSDMLGVGERTARRILKKILDSGFGAIAAKESVTQRGRPKSIIKIQL